MLYPKEAEDYLYQAIPLAAHMGVRVMRYDGMHVQISAPLQMNINHANTVFGGSLVSVSILAGWMLLMLKCKESGLHPHLVIQHSNMDFIGPVKSDFDAVCSFSDVGVWEKFNRMLHKFGKARIGLDTEVRDGKRCLAKHDGQYVAMQVVRSIVRK